MLETLDQNRKNNFGKVLADGWKPVKLHFSPGEKTLVEFDNGKKAFSSCIGCYDTPCMNFSEAEVIPSNFSNFPADKNTDVCATGAISLQSGYMPPAIDSNKCILCGVCAIRCPVGAISINPSIGAIIESSSNEAFEGPPICIINGGDEAFNFMAYGQKHPNTIKYLEENTLRIINNPMLSKEMRDEAAAHLKYIRSTPEREDALIMSINADMKKHQNRIETFNKKKELTRNAFINIISEGSFLFEDDSIVDDIFLKLKKISRIIGDRFPNILSRNLLLGAGINASTGRKGGNFMRMDIILAPPGVQKNGVVEVEFGQEAVLDAPRDILDALAVLISRYEWSVSSTSAIIISDVLPNRRSEYWHIIQDISNVVNVKIGTLTIFALMLCIWNRKTLNLNESVFYADRNTDSYRSQVLEPIIGRVLNLGYSPKPQIDIAK